MISLLSLALVASSIQPVAAMLSCDRVLADGQRFDFSKLKGPHSVVTTQHTPPTEQNTTYTVSLCGPLERTGNVPKGEKCPNGSWACAIKRWTNPEDGTSGIGQVIPLAGNLQDHGGGALEHTATRLKTADSHSDAQKEGLRLVLQGGRYPMDGPAKDRQKQRVIVELICDMEREGTEGEWAVGDYKGSAGVPAAAPAAPGNASMIAEGADAGFSTREDHPGEKQLTREGEDPALVFQGYEVHDADSAFGTLRLTWYTKYACESMGGSQSDHWGLFTWFVILVFLATASYLIFGSWLNYNRYGARGWDLLPHGDTLRDVPYLLKDWVRRLINTLQGSGSRGGYSAV